MFRFLAPVPLALSLALLVAAQATAQDARWSVGLKPGFTLSTLGGDDAERYNISYCRDDDERTDGRSCIARPGFSLGGFASFRITPTIAIQPELYYVQKGGRYSYYERPHPRWFPVGEIVTYTRVLDYVEIPLLLRWRRDIGIFRLAVPTAHIGPALAFSVSSRDQRSGEGGRYERDDDLMEHTNSLDVGVAFGGGVDILLLGPGAIIIEARATIGLLEVGPPYFPIEPKQAFSTDQTNLFNRAFTIHIGYGYPF